MNIILHLFNEQFIIDLFKERVLPKYPDFVDIKKIKIEPIKKNIWETTFHVVIKFKTTFLTSEGKIKKLDIYCTAHSNEPRKNVYDGLKYLWDNGFCQGRFTIPHPLFYSNQFKAVFYRGVQGHNLYYYIRTKNYTEVESIVIKAAAWFAKLHTLPIEKARNFNKENSRIATVFPHSEFTLTKIKSSYSNFYHIYKQALGIFIDQEEKFLRSTQRRWLVHGDAHPENIIKISKTKLAMIDFTDICLADFARDLGTFWQQFEYMSIRKVKDRKYPEKIKSLFLENYLVYTKIKLDKALQRRINNYYNWTAIRTATFFLLKDNPEPERAKPLLKQICKNLNIN